MKYVPPTIRDTAFNCPHCRALATQYWYSAHADALDKGKLPLVIDESKLKDLTLDHVEEPSEKERLKKWAARAAKGRPFFGYQKHYSGLDVTNVWFSRCYNCSEVALWICGKMLYPHAGEAPPANPDMPDDVRRDYEEASTILDRSPRGAAALIRLAIQKLCKELGQPGKNINDDIGALVKSGLNRRVQQALDAVRVIGNSAVHPGQIDIRDDRATAETLFKLLNLIVEKTISEPKHVDEVYSSLPESALRAIEKRDEKE